MAANFLQLMPRFEWCRQDPSLVLPSFDRSQQVRTLWVSSVPMVVMLLALVALVAALKAGRAMDKNKHDKDL